MGARLGLFALVLQLALSFAHVHPLPASVSTLSAPAGNTSPDLPEADGGCAICASIAALATLDLPQQAALIPLVSVAETLAPASATGEHHATPILHFSSRAPPFA